MAVLLAACATTPEQGSRYREPDVEFTLQVTQLPDYEKDIDHKRLINALDDRYDEALRTGQEIFKRTCINCHGTPGQPGSIPTALKFWADSFKVGNDPYAIYQTLTRGYGSMPPQMDLTPVEKYDVIHYIREVFVRTQNRGQYFDIDSTYLTSLPAGKSIGPSPGDFKPWAEMDYGNFLINTYELVGLNAPPRERSTGKAPLPDENLVNANFAYKGIAVRVNEGPGGVAAGNAWMVFDHDVMRVAGAWTGEGFIDWEGILFNGKHNISPRTVGDLHFENPVGPGWAHPVSGSFEDVRFMARDKRRFGPLPRDWAHYKGLYQYGDKVIISYTVGNAEVLESFGMEKANDQPVFTRTLNVGASSRPLKMRVAPVGTAVAVVGKGVKLTESRGFIVMEVPQQTPVRVKLLLARAGTDLQQYAGTSSGPENLVQLTKGGPARYPEKLSTAIERDDQKGAFQVDVLQLPYNSPWKNQLRLSGIDFVGDKALVCSSDGDVWLVEGITQNSGELSWQRIASGLFQPLGIKVVKGDVFVTCRDQIVRLHDLNGDGETDYYESFNSDHQVTDHFHEFAMGLQADAEGNLYYAKSARHARKALVPQHGTLLKVSKDGLRTEVVAHGFRAANGVCINPDGTFIVTDQEGHWNPMSRINWVTPGKFYGNMFGYDPPADTADNAMEQPVVWVERHHDQSPSELLWVESKKWGPLNGSLLSFSYGYGKVFIVPHEVADGQVQGGIFELPIKRFSTGVMRGRFNPLDGQLYACGLSAWGSTQPMLGGLYRVRYTGKDALIPVALHARKQGIEIGFSAELDRKMASDTANYKVVTWDLKRSRLYGSRHYNVKSLKVTEAAVSANGKSVLLTIPDIRPTWVMEITYVFKDASGEEVKGVIQNTIHRLREENPL